MKLLIVISLIACSYADKLDRTYLPPASAASAGGSPGFLNAPLRPSGSSNFGQSGPNTSGFGQAAGPSTFGQSTGPAGSNGALGKISGSFGAQPSGSNGFAPSSQYGAPGSSAGSIDAGFGQVAQNFGQDYQRNQPERAQASVEKNAEILRLDNQNDGETFAYNFETSNGIAAEESGVATNGVQAQGAFSYTDDDGQLFRVAYTADENGYQPQGDHLPTPHPIPEEILKSIERNAQAAAAGTQEGAYNPNEDNSNFASEQYSYNAPTSYNQAPSGTGSFKSQGNAPSALYAVPNSAGTASRPQTSAQLFQPQGSSQQYGAPNAASPARPSNGFGQPQTKAPFQPNGSPSTGGSSNAGVFQARPNSFSQNQFQPQGPSQQYGTPSGFAQSRPASKGFPSSNPAASGSNGFASSSPVAPISNGFSPSGPAAPVSNGFAPSGSQPKPSQYNAPSQTGQVFSGRPSGQAQGDSGYQYDRPQSGVLGQGNGRPSSQSSGGQYRPQNGAAQSSVSQGFARPNSNNAGYGAPSGPQGSVGSSSSPSSQGSFGPSASAPNAFGSSSGAKGPSSFGPAGPSAQGAFGSSSGPSAFGPSGSNSQPSFGTSGQSFRRPQGSQASGSMPQSGYEYNRPGQNGPTGASQGSFKTPGSSGQAFGGARQPPSFSEQEGYKY